MKNRSWAPRDRDPEPTFAERLLAVLFGSDLQPTSRGLIVARVALALGALVLVLLIAFGLTETANAIVDPSLA